MNSKVIGIIPARFASSRFPGKPLIDIHGKTMIQRVYEQAKAAGMLSRVVVATDDNRIFNEVNSFGGEVFMTSDKHQSGTDRCAELVNMLALQADEVVINIQGDEPFIQPEQIDTLCRCFNSEEVQLATLVKSFRNTEEIRNPNTIKVVLNNQGYAMYFSRLPIPYARDFSGLPADVSSYVQHIGIYGYRVSTLLQVAELPVSTLEFTEKLEQLRWLENGYKIMTARSEHESWSIDTPEDLEKVKQHFFPS